MTRKAINTKSPDEDQGVPISDRVFGLIAFQTASVRTCETESIYPLGFEPSANLQAAPLAGQGRPRLKGHGNGIGATRFTAFCLSAGDLVRDVLCSRPGETDLQI